MTFSAFAARRERSKSLGKEDHELQFDDLLQAGGVTEAATKERLQVLMDAQRGRGSLLFRSQAEFAMLPPLITWKEFRECMHAWSKHQRLLRDEVFVQAMWAGAVSRRIQYRRQLEILEGRDVLIASGAAASALSVPDWLAERLPAQSSGKPAEARDVDAIE
jgi:hypothetical protein